MQELQRKYGNDQQKFAEEYQKLLKSRNTTMMSSMGCSGCLIQLIQIPIIFGMFYMMMSPLTHIMKIDDEKILEYKDEINAARKAEMIAKIESTSGEYPEEELKKIIENAEKATYVDQRYYEIDIINDRELLVLNEEDKEKLNFNMDFLGINLCDVAAKNTDNKRLLIIPILSTGFTYLSLAISAYFNKKKGIKTPKPEDSEIIMPDMRLMNIMMPLMIGYVAYSVPQGVGLYWTISNLIGVIQLVALKLIFDKELFKKKDTLKNVKYDVIKDNNSCTELIVTHKKKTNKKKKSKNKKKK